MWKSIIVLTLGLLTQPMNIWAEETLEEKRVTAIAAAEEIINMRSSLAQAFITPDTDITETTFKKVCGAVAMRVMDITEKENLTIRHAAIKNRNQNFAARPDEAKILEKFDKNRDLWELWDTIEIDEKIHQRYMRPIFVEAACIACHGSKDKRPQFIVEKYPNDKAFDFKVGDLRGMIEIIFPLSQ